MKALIVFISLNMALANWQDERCSLINKVITLNEEVVPFKKNGDQIIIIDKLKDQLNCEFDASITFSFVNELPDSPTIFYSLDSINSYAAFGIQNMGFGVYFSDSKGEEIIMFLLLKEETNNDLTLLEIKTYNESRNR